ncbi:MULTISPECIES: hypothetical protein [Curtobacterium]|nr:hypothetical protein [Curtobacterium flaccumfaciens]MCS0644131.1 hypothetical protein [Curtobacterium flaccumfaciens pv. flaccumfaciens]MCS5495520.1 hypothetical protein [Curtobacterium flaccumfaciens pv. flaccumfaciens]MCS5507598.1 hypothetical protein [Curtobacterium flaccumfaciens pv. flaccumfaciens]MCS5511086.1 hypothetical protein [Curtobacterium flaccumfaciens pv. flaccumfaciens]MCS6527808.1 hypothetical protein [Curtobacterium flaccumfaciens pv. flaccumfaciens]
MMRTIRRILRDERGDVEDLPPVTIIIIGAMVPIVAFGIFLGRYGLTDNSVQSAAFAAARDASMSRGTDAVAHATEAAQLALGDNAHCASLDVTIGGNGLSTSLGQTGTVTATITCRINTADLSVPFIPGSMTITKTASSPVDPYRER